MCSSCALDNISFFENIVATGIKEDFVPLNMRKRVCIVGAHSGSDAFYLIFGFYSVDRHMIFEF